MQRDFLDAGGCEVVKAATNPVQAAKKVAGIESGQLVNADDSGENWEEFRSHWGNGVEP